MRFLRRLARSEIVVRRSKPRSLERLPSLSRGIRLTGVIDLLTVKRRREEMREEILRLARQYHAADVRVFGSVSRGESSEESDLDILIRTEPGCSLFDLGGLLEDLQELLQCRVDLVVEDGLKPRLRTRVLREAVPL